MGVSEFDIVKGVWFEGAALDNMSNRLSASMRLQ